MVSSCCNSTLNCEGRRYQVLFSARPRTRIVPEGHWLGRNRWSSRWSARGRHARGESFRIQGRFVGEALAQAGIGSQVQDGVSILWVVESDPFDGTGQSIHLDKYTRHGTNFTSDRLRLTASILCFLILPGLPNNPFFTYTYPCRKKELKIPKSR